MSSRSVHDLEKHGQSTHPPDDKHSVETLLSESKRLIKSGFYKKAFNLIDNFKLDTYTTSPACYVKLCRRMVICLTRICSRYLIKGDINRMDHFVNLMNKTYDYLQMWHDNICTHVSKSNPKYSHLQTVYDEMSDSFDDGFDVANPLRVKINKDASRHNSSIFSAGDSRMDTKPSSFLSKLKPNAFSGRVERERERRATFLEDTYNVEVHSRVGTETVPNYEINASFHLDEFIKYYLTAMLNWANFFKKVMKNYTAAYKILIMASKISKVIDSCLDPDLLQVAAQIKVALGVFYSEFGRYREALELFESAINVLQIQISLRVNKGKENKNNYNLMYKFKATIRLLILVLINMAIVYEQTENYPKTIESLRLGSWFALKFISFDDEIQQIVNTQYNIALQKYDRYLKELGEIERIAGGGVEATLAEEGKDEVNKDHFAKLNQFLYNKFNYDKLNTSQKIVITSPLPKERNSTFRSNRSELALEDKIDLAENKQSWSKIRELQSADGSVARMPTMDSNESPLGTSLKRQSVTISRSILGGKDKKKGKYRRFGTMTEDSLRPLTSHRYKMSMDNIEKEKIELVLNNEEEKTMIEQLNSNIKRRERQTKNKKKSKVIEKDYLDIDHYFDKMVDIKIKEKEEEMKLMPIEFKGIVKNYAHFLKNENFDDIEFKFASRSLTAKHRENLGDYDSRNRKKYNPPAPKLAQVNQVKLDAQFIEAKAETENRVNQKAAFMKSISSPKASSQQSKTVKFAQQLSTLDIKAPTLPIIEEQTTSNRNINKPKMSMILMRHKSDLGLESVHAMMKEKEKQEMKENEIQKQKTEMAMFFGSKSPKSPVPKVGYTSAPRTESMERDPVKMRKFSETAKNMIQLLMESVEKTIEEDSNIRQRIQENKPLVEIQKANQRFLKTADDLAKSTQNLSLAAEGKRKMWNFSQLVKSAQVFSKKVTIKSPKNEL